MRNACDRSAGTASSRRTRRLATTPAANAAASAMAMTAPVAAGGAALVMGGLRVARLSKAAAGVGSPVTSISAASTRRQGLGGRPCETGTLLNTGKIVLRARYTEQ